MLRTLLLCLVAGFLTWADSHAEVIVGKVAPDFTLMDTHGKMRKLSDFKDKYIVLEWLNSDCPFVKAHYNSGVMQALQQKYTSKGCAWLSIVSSALGKQGNYSPAELNKKMTAWKSSQTAVLLDSDGKVGKLYGAKTTPHMFVINPQGILIYEGAIDDRPSTDKKDAMNAKNYVEAALDEAMQGKPVTTSHTQPYGCSVKY
jgi:peroxiredoxin